MSYSGFSQFFCSKGHYWTEDCNLVMYNDLEDNKCPICREPAVFENMVDTTNGSFDDEEGGTGERIDGYIEPKIKLQTSGVCSACGEKHICNTTYEIPEKVIEDDEEREPQQEVVEEDEE